MNEQLGYNVKKAAALNALKEKGLIRSSDGPILMHQEASSYPLSFAQERMWFHEKLHPGSPLFNTPISFEIIGDLNLNALKSAFNSIVQRHEVLRSAFRERDGVVVQVPLQVSEVAIKIEDLTRVPLEERPQEARALAEQWISAPMSPSSGHVFSPRLIRLGEAHWWLVVLIHHLVFDGLSESLLLKEISIWYNKHLDQGEPLPDLPLQYGDFARWQRDGAQSSKIAEQLNWWLEQLKGAPHLLSLPIDRPRPPVQNFRGRVHQFELSPEVTLGVQDFASKRHMTVFPVITAAFKLLLYRLTGQADLVVSTGTANKQIQELDPIIGCFVNMILLRTKFDLAKTCEDLVELVRDNSIEAFQHQDLPFDHLVSSLSPERDLSYNPLAQVMIVFHNEDDDKKIFPGADVKRVVLDRGISQFDLLLRVISEGDRLNLIFEYNTDLFDQVTVERMSQQYLFIIDQLLRNPAKEIEEVRTLPDNQIAELLHKNDVNLAFSDGLCIHQIFEKTVNKFPNSTALICDQEIFSYSELNDLSNKIARRILEEDIKPGDLVGICLERSPIMVAAMLAIAKCGAAYIPIDPSYPQERLNFIIEDSLPALIVCSQNTSGKFSSEALLSIFELDKEIDHLSSYRSENLDIKTDPLDLLYLIYTSGSTGRPKGVMLNHQGRVNNFEDFNRRFEVGPEDKLLGISSLSFDMCAYDVFGTLMAGATLVLSSGDGTPNPEMWIDLICKHGVTIWHSAPALLEEVLGCFRSGSTEAAPSLRLALLGGDWIPLNMPEEFKRFAGGDVTFVSLGGATEASMDSTIYVVEEVDGTWNSIPYGSPMTNQEVYILDNKLELAPIGVAGDLYIGGCGVGWGYFQRPDLTATRFVPNPYSDEGGARIYRTGDIARWTNCGELELLGRADFQVKLNGLRIELGEIEAALSRAPGVKACVVKLVRSSKSSPRLVSYVVPEVNGFDWERTRAELFELLPAYMVPRQCVTLEKLPLSPNGKILRTALPEPENAISSPTESEGPRTIWEKTLQTVWESVLGTNQFGIDHDFFALGGNSLQAAKIVNRINQEFTLVEFMRYSTIRQQAKVLGSSDRRRRSLSFQFPRNVPQQKQLICVPYAGGSPIIFRGIAENLPDYVGISVPCMPSLEDCKAQSLTLEKIAEMYLEEMNFFSDSDQPIAVYGHCAGTVLATEIAQQLQRAGRQVEVLFLAAAMPPGIPSPFSMPHNTDAEIVEFVAALGGTEESGDPDDWAVMVEEFKRDSKLVREYSDRVFSLDHQYSITCPLVVLMGDNDPLTEGHALYRAKWSCVSKEFSVMEVSGGHYFISDAAPQVANFIAEHIT
ncbi:amino acid adenylation domain-containing protein [uncultured Thalassospira sp.]|uniref:non-ribosomal peptide synthetase n=1 Tax=uncultured Thalassospira sp. TaxID=404382 RepID=UPI00258A2D6C|nr:amino acid adenylation domain-containing protein [uncultured Thalassospira sp.]